MKASVAPGVDFIKQSTPGSTGTEEHHATSEYLKTLNSFSSPHLYI
jgi:deoxyribose-phosphate aldolase